AARVLARMSTRPQKAALPATVEECHAALLDRDLRIAEFDAVVSEHIAAIAERDAKIADLRAQLAKLQKQLFGRKSERAPQPDPTPAEIAEEAAPPRPRRHTGGGRKPLPETLARTTEIVDIADGEKTCPCCGGPLTLIGTDATEQLDARP